MFKLFIEGGAAGMSMITIALIGVFFCAWKAPAWVKEVGIMALVIGIFWQLLGLYYAADAVQSAGDIPVSLIAAGYKVSLIPIIYGCIVYFISLVIRMIQKPKI
ncbi:MAG: hypothetical protein PHD07_08395 [Bacteroidales bacterium]|nr:hypothetical protein [Bacteroidales bacterium]MDD3202089.1 hypothetical protein [Bacteroidales bacterium]